MFARGLRQFYIDEVAKLDSGKKVIPLAWIKRGGELCADCLDAIPDAVSNFFPFTVWNIQKKIKEQLENWARHYKCPCFIISL
jgi:hypothetical protein